MGKAAWNNVDQWMRFNGDPISFQAPDRWLKGPFFFDITFEIAGAIINILDSAVLNSDPQFNSTFGSVQNPEIVLHVNWLHLITADNVQRLATPVDKETIWKQCEAKFRKGQRNVSYPLGQTQRELWQEFQQSATAEIAPMDGYGAYRIPNGIEVDTINDALTLPALTTPIVADLDYQLVVGGFIFPSKATRDKLITGDSYTCGPNDGVANPVTATEMIGARALFLTNAPLDMPTGKGVVRG